MQSLAALLLLLCTHSFAYAWAGAPVDARQDLADKVLYLEDNSGELDFTTITAAPKSQWRRNLKPVFSKGYSQSTWWLKFQIANHDSNAIKRFLEIGYPQLDHVTVYVLERNNYQQYSMGDALPFAQRPIQSPNFVVPISVAGGTEVEVYLKVRSDNSLQVPLNLWQPAEFYRHERNTSLLQGFYYGIILVMALYNLFVYVATREKAFLLYVVFTLTLALFIATLKGYGFAYLWPNHPQWINLSILWSLSLALIFGSLFTEHFLKIRQLGNWAIYMIRTVQFITTAIIPISLFVDYSHLIRLVIVIACVVCCMGLAIGLIMWNRGGSSARYYTVGWSAVLMGGAAIGMNKLGLIQPGLLSENTLQVGSSLEVILLSFALAERINEERRMRAKAQDVALHTERAVRQAKEAALVLQKKNQEQLETRVHERTRELEQVNRRLAEVSETDQLTGLKNRRHMDQFLLEELHRCNRFQREFSILLVDIDHFKEFNDRYGHLMGDKCLQAVAHLIQQNTRGGIDCAARYGGEEFCLLLPETGTTAAMDAAHRILAQVESMHLEVQGQPVTITASLGVASRLPQESISSTTLMERADEALYAAKKAGRNRVTLSASNVRNQEHLFGNNKGPRQKSS